jgi:MoaA/NifB/PqqE/SkfB family radical SAM enzyme
VPFQTPRAQRRVVEAIVDRVASLGFRNITFGGGDPFQYSYIGDLARRAKGAGLYVHIDTHGKSLAASQRTESILRDAVDLIGLPLDGPTREVHDGMRSSPGHFDAVVKRLRWLKRLPVPVKINTIVSRRNVDSIPELATFVENLAPWRWSIYQYMPLGPGASVERTHAMTAAEFESAQVTVSARLGPRAARLLEIADKDGRRSTYPIVHHDGTVFGHSSVDAGVMVPVCSIFEARARELINNACGPERSEAATRYTTTRLGREP